MTDAINKQNVIDQINALTADGTFSQNDVNYLINYLIANGDMTGTPRDLIQVRRGNVADLPNLAQGELAFTLDSEELFIGGMNGSVKIGKMSLFVGVKQSPYNAKGDSTTDDSTTIQNAINDSTSLDNTVYFATGNYRIGTNITIPAGVTLWFAPNAKLSIDAGVTVTINGYIQATNHQIFAGAGSVAGIMQNETVRAEWFGVPISDTTVSSSSALQAAINYCQVAGKSLTLPKNGKFRLDSQVVINHGKNASGDQSMNLTLLGNGCVVYPNLNDYAIFVKPLCVAANVGSGYEVANVNISDITFDNYFGTSNAYTQSAALKIGRGGYRFDGFVQSRFDRIFTSGFTRQPIAIESARMLKFEQLYMRGNAGIWIGCLTLGDFCGDMEFESCEFSGSTSVRPIEITAYTASGSPRPEVRGIRFENCVIYGSGTYINASTNCLVGDIWFEDCAWDSGLSGQDAIAILANGSANIVQVIFQNPYIVNHTGHAIYVETQSTSSILHLEIRGGQIGEITAPNSDGAIYLLGAEHAMIQGVSMSEITGSQAIQLDGGGTNISVQNNIVKNSTITNMISVGNTTDFIITGNMGKGGVNDWAGAVNKVVANNLTTAS